MSKKIIAVVLSVLMMFSTFIVPVFATQDEETTDEIIVISDTEPDGAEEDAEEAGFFSTIGSLICAIINLFVKSTGSASKATRILQVVFDLLDEGIAIATETM